MKDWYTEKRVSRSIFGSILEYEYLYLNGELDIDCIYLKKRREHIGIFYSTIFKYVYNKSKCN